MSYRVQAPVRAMFERSEDMVNTGARQPFKGIYKVNTLFKINFIKIQYLLGWVYK